MHTRGNEYYRFLPVRINNRLMMIGHLISHLVELFFNCLSPLGLFLRTYASLLLFILLKNWQILIRCPFDFLEFFPLLGHTRITYRWATVWSFITYFSQWVINWDIRTCFPPESRTARTFSFLFYRGIHLALNMCRGLNERNNGDLSLPWIHKKRKEKSSSC